MNDTYTNQVSSTVTELLNNSGLRLSQITTCETIQNDYKEFITNYDKNVIETGFTLLDGLFDGGIRPKELVTVIGSTGLGKSIFALNTLFNMSYLYPEEIFCLFSLEMHSISIYERILQMYLKKTSFEIRKEIESNSLNDKLAAMQDELKNLYIITGRVTVKQIENTLKVIQLLRGTLPKFIVVDYIGLIPANQNETEYNTITRAMRELYSMANEFDISIMNITQSGRADVKTGELGLYSGKGSGEIENSSDFYLTLELAKLKPNDDNNLKSKLNIIENWNIEQAKKSGEVVLLKVTNHKSRRGDKGAFYITFNKRTLLMKEFKEFDYQIKNVF